MIDFYFSRCINLNDILKDGFFEIKKVEGDNWLWFGLKGPDNEGSLYVNYDEEGYFDYAEGHGSKVAFYLYDKYGVLFHDDCEYLFEIQDFLDLDDPSNYNDWKKIVEYVSLRHMQHYIHEGAGDIYTKLIEQTAKAKVDFDEVMERTGIQKKIDERHQK